MLFQGPAGTGKTSTILETDQTTLWDHNHHNLKSRVLELNASDDSISIVRDKIKKFATFNRYRIQVETTWKIMYAYLLKSLFWMKLIR